MPRQEHVLTVFVASPSDVEDERDKLEDVIRELNVTWSRELSVRLELVRWETHACPGMGVDAQAVINEQVPDDFDLFIGIMWCRYGTPTGRAGSGTIEEFERAKARYEADPSSVRLMVYFKDDPIPPSELDLSQLAKVHEFRRSLGDEGALYRSFIGIDQFEGLIRLHLTRQAQAWKKTSDQSNKSAIAKQNDVSVSEAATGDEGDDLGILDLLETAEERFEELGDISERIAKATADLAQKMTDRTTEIETLPRDSTGNPNRKAAKKSIAKAAYDMRQFTACIDAELPQYTAALNTGMNFQMQAWSLSADFTSEPAFVYQAKEGLGAIVTLRRGLADTVESTCEFRATMAALPRMTTDLNRARRGVTAVLDRLLEEFTNGETLLGEAEEAVRELIGE